MPGSVLGAGSLSNKGKCLSGGTHSLAGRGACIEDQRGSLRQVLSWEPSAGGFETIRGESPDNSDTTTLDGSGEGGLAFLEHIPRISLLDAHCVPVR